MSAIRNVCRDLRLSTRLALLVLGALLVCGQVADVAHAEMHCEPDTCSLCAGSAADTALVDSLSQQATPGRERQGEPVRPTGAEPACLPATQFIRGPPEA